jgi:predicted nucleic acid-binding protein
MAYSHLFIDSDVLLDMLLNRDPFSAYTKFLLFESETRKLKLSTSSLVIANINYILAKKIGVSATKESIRRLIKLIHVLPFEGDIIDLALTSNITDFEDAIQNLIAERYKCDVIITRNVKDYKESAITVLTAEQFLSTL